MEGKLITLEGPDGAGKSTQVSLLASALKARGYPVLVTREPGGTRLGEEIRGLLLNPLYGEMNHVTEALLYAGARAQLVGEVILPALAAGVTVLCDRFVDSSLAYQGYGRGLDLGMLRAINGFALKQLGSFLTILLDLPPEEGLRRAAAGRRGDRLEQEDLDFHKRVRDGYLALAASNPERIVVVAAAAPVSAVQQSVLKHALAYLEGKRKGASF